MSCFGICKTITRTSDSEEIRPEKLPTGGENGENEKILVQVRGLVDTEVAISSDLSEITCAAVRKHDDH